MPGNTVHLPNSFFKTYGHRIVFVRIWKKQPGVGFFHTSEWWTFVQIFGILYATVPEFFI